MPRTKIKQNPAALPVPRQQSLRETFETAPSERIAQIYRAAANLFCEKGFDGTTMSDVAEVVGVTKAAIYHFVPGGKQDLLYAVVSYGLARLEEHVIIPARAIPDAETRLRTIIRNHVFIITGGVVKGKYNPVTIVVDEVGGLSTQLRKKIDQRKRVYIDLIRETLEQLRAEGKLADVDITVAAFSLLSTVLWVARWYSPNGRLTAEQINHEISKLMLGSLLLPAKKSAATKKTAPLL